MPRAGRRCLIIATGYSARRMVAYAYRGPVELVDDFYREVERILRERGVL
jgi:hypothetical protein